jgi:glutathione S-transferase
MSLKLHYHPLSSYCWKTLIALYEGEVAFEPVLVNLGDEASRAAFLKLWPIGKFPVLEDTANGAVIPESSVIFDYLQAYAPNFPALIPNDKKRAIEARLKDRFFDLYIHNPMQRIVGEALRTENVRDPLNLSEARAQIRTALNALESEIGGAWALGDDFTIADCAASPALYYANRVAPFAHTHPKSAAYLERLKQRPSFARVIQEAEPFAHFFPGQQGVPL